MIFYQKIQESPWILIGFFQVLRLDLDEVRWKSSKFFGKSVKFMEIH